MPLYAPQRAPGNPHNPTAYAHKLHNRAEALLMVIHHRDNQHKYMHTPKIVIKINNTKYKAHYS